MRGSLTPEIALHESTRELTKGDARIRLQEQPFQVLQLLLDRPGAVITRDELRDRLWPNGTFVDFEHSLNAAVKRLRAALGDDAREPRYIETLPRRGYRWIAAALPRRRDEMPRGRPGRIEILWAFGLPRRYVLPLDAHVATSSRPIIAKSKRSRCSARTISSFGR